MLVMVAFWKISWEPRGCSGEAFGAVLGPSWAVLEPSWGHLGLSLGDLGGLWGYLWTILKALGRLGTSLTAGSGLSTKHEAVIIKQDA